jgi:hypothetical protein
MPLFSQLAQVNNGYYTSSSTSGSSLGVLIGIAAVFGVISIVGLWKVFVKAGRPGWAAIIPVYNLWVLFEIAGKPGWWALLSLLAAIPVLGIVASLALFVISILAAIELSRRFGKSGGFTALLIFFPYIAYLILGFGSATYNPAASADNDKPFTGPTPTPPPADPGSNSTSPTPPPAAPVV